MTEQFTPNTLDVDHGRPSKTRRDVTGRWQALCPADEVVEVEIVTTTRHRITRRALAQALQDVDQGVRGVSVVGYLLRDHDEVPQGAGGRGALHQDTILVYPAGQALLGGIEHRATLAANAVIRQPGFGQLARWCSLHHAAVNEARAAAGFPALQPATDDDGGAR